MPGQVGNVVVGGHRTSKHRVFRHLDDLVAGDQIIFQDANGEHVYLVNRVEIVDPTTCGSSTRRTRPPPRCSLAIRLARPGSASSCSPISKSDLAA